MSRACAGLEEASVGSCEADGALDRGHCRSLVVVDARRDEDRLGCRLGIVAAVDLLSLHRYRDLGEHVLSFLLQMRRTLVEAGKGVLVEHEEAGNPSSLVLFRGHLRQKVVHQLDALLIRLVLFDSQVHRLRGEIIRAIFEYERLARFELAHLLVLIGPLDGLRRHIGLSILSRFLAESAKHLD